MRIKVGEWYYCIPYQEAVMVRNIREDAHGKPLIDVILTSREDGHAVMRPQELGSLSNLVTILCPVCGCAIWLLDAVVRMAPQHGTYCQDCYVKRYGKMPPKAD